MAPPVSIVTVNDGAGVFRNSAVEATENTELKGGVVLHPMFPLSSEDTVEGKSPAVRLR